LEVDGFRWGLLFLFFLVPECFFVFFSLDVLLPGRFPDTGELALQSLEAELEAAEAEGTEDTTATAGLEAAVVDGGGTSVSGEGVELELGLGADLGGEGGVMGQVPECLADNF
jgi:hypothetical protein